ncbi:hypothetical protein H6CHR_03044 [Variovorax sp. PBL-H6]|uniref:hypothetical protein n=1 Tax=Variovorax sp. PBL-H6 TaxID=434009 RepID=UPI00131696FB|nr:hypothetical protein [Variovorax sp. PBL-H6]VTU28700.1 hypothetical protein H6CHR_03044 [Variovorax sp. PBL-H6]
MKCFWLGTWGAGAGGVPGAIEVLQDRDRYVVLISAVDDPGTPTHLKCQIGFANDAKACNLWRSRGFPVVDAAIRLSGGSTIEVLSPYFANSENRMRYGDLLLSIDGVRFEQAADSTQQLSASYRQYKETPSTSKPATELQRESVQWQPARSLVKKAGAAGATIDASAARKPSLSPLASGKTVVADVWTGVYEDPAEPGLPKSAQRKIVDRRAEHGDAAFQFSDIDVLSMRIELGKSDPVKKGLRELIAPLNFPVPPSDPGFTFEVATSVIQVMLLRYGRMQEAEGGATADYQSQHELVVRLLVGKVDSGGSTYNDLAVHAPAIFVDNPWSKVIGRELQGFEKCLAAFCVGQDGARSRLNPDGGLAGGSGSRPLSDITRIELVDLVSNDPTSNGWPLLDIRSPPDEGEWKLPQRPGGLSLMESNRKDAAWPGWRIEDFGTQVQFDGSLLNRLWYELNLFDSIQATPIDNRGLVPAWISAVCKVDDLTYQSPPGSPAAQVHVTFHAPDAAPRGWQKLCDLLGPDNLTRDVSDWYRSKFSMTLTGQDELYGGHSGG